MGTDEVETPALVVDLDAVDSNVQGLSEFLTHTATRWRPLVSTHGCPALARRQVAADVDIAGVAVYSIGQAEVFVAAGFSDVFVDRPVVTARGIRRLCDLAHVAKIRVPVDRMENAKDLGRWANHTGVVIHAAVEVNALPSRAGAAVGSLVIDLAELVTIAQGLRFWGVIAHGHGQSPFREGTTHDVTRKLLEAQSVLTASGQHAPSTILADPHELTAAAVQGITEIVEGGATFTGGLSSSRASAAAWVLASVISRPEEGIAVIDAGHKALAPDWGLPQVQSHAGIRVGRMSAEHSVLFLGETLRGAIDVGTTLRLAPAVMELTFNQFDRAYAVREGGVKAVWQLSGRGRFN